MIRDRVCKINEAKGRSFDHVMIEGLIDIEFIPMASNPAISAIENDLNTIVVRQRTSMPFSNL
jgi:hypothetical protein